MVYITLYLRVQVRRQFAIHSRFNSIGAREGNTEICLLRGLVHSTATLFAKRMSQVSMPLANCEILFAFRYCEVVRGHGQKVNGGGTMGSATGTAVAVPVETLL